MFVTNNGELYSCGSNKYGQLGTMDDSDQSSDSNESSCYEEEEEEVQASGNKENYFPSSESETMNPKAKKMYENLKKRED